MTVHYYDASSGTPHRSELQKHRGDLTATRMYTTEYQPDVEQAVEQDFSLHYRLTDTGHFLDKLLPVEQAIVDSILQTEEVSRLYNSRSKRWVGFSEPGSKFRENSLYGPFNDIVEAIRLTAEKLRSTTASDVGPTMWADYHSKSPKTQDSQAAQLRPDVLFALKHVADHAKSEEYEVRIRSLCDFVMLERFVGKASKESGRFPADLVATSHCCSRGEAFGFG